ncbi:MAG: hypothetical protein ACJASL_000907 [Paraglaciecola sp.]|jgi:hypothetical protein
MSFNAYRIIQAVILISLVNFGLVSCATNSSDVVHRDIGKFSAASVANPSFKPQVGDTFAWYSSVFVEDSFSGTKVTEEARRTITKLISNYMADANYKIVSNAQNATYLISAMVVVGDRKIQDVAPYFKAHPQIAKSVNNYQDGTLLVAIGKHNQGPASLMWEGAIQAYVVGEDLSEEQRVKRLKLMVKRLMNGLPKPN